MSAAGGDEPVSAGPLALTAAGSHRYRPDGDERDQAGRSSGPLSGRARSGRARSGRAGSGRGPGAGRTRGARSPLGRWWDERSVAFRKTVRTLTLLVVTCAISLLLGIATATATSPVGPHNATWSTTLDSTVTMDLGPLGQVSLDSPVSPLGADIVIGEIPGESDPDAASVAALGQALSSDGAAYVSLVTHPRLTIESGVRALADDALRRAGLTQSVLLCMVAAGRLATGGRLRDGVRSLLSRGPASVIVVATVLATSLSLLVPAVRSRPVTGTTLSVLADTPLAGARLSGRVADVVRAYGGRVKAFLDDNEAFYAQAELNLRAAWAASADVDGLVAVTAADGVVDRDALAAAASAAAPRSPGAVLARTRSTGTAALGTEGAAGTDGTAGGDGTAATDDTAGTGGTAETDAATEAPGTASGAAGDGSGGPSTSGGSALATGAIAVERSGATTVVMSTDLHCNLDVIAFTGVLDEVAGAEVHMDDGDLTMTGSDPEQVCVDALSNAVPEGVARVATVGNHDSQSTAERLRAQGWTVTDGTVQQVGPLSVLGDVDVERTTATGTVQRGDENAEQLGQRLATTSCTAAQDGNAPDLVLVHEPYTFPPLVSEGCSPLLLAGHVHRERGMTVSAGGATTVAQLTSGAGKGGTSIGQVTEDAYLHVLSFDEDGNLLGWRAVVLHPDASVTVGAWNPVPAAGTTGQGAAQ